MCPVDCCLSRYVFCAGHGSRVVWSWYRAHVAVAVAGDVVDAVVVVAVDVLRRPLTTTD